MKEVPMAEPAPPPVQGEEEHPSLALANSTIAMPGGRTVDLLGTPAQANRWLTERGLAPVDVAMQEMCATQLRSLREQIRSLFASRAAGLPALPAAVAAINDAMTRVPTAPLLHWDEKTGPYRATPHPTTAIVDHALATLAADAADLLTGPDAERLTACGSPPCNRYLLRHGRRHWCSTRCGDRARAARAYARRTRPGTD
ncbi:CGNR zinc finger domain-containing protein [Streptomyces smyrnaeus]|uniref:CGNR zinc finger domain-containing protein n=1 Tax=Streptomyces smyrnaeus TaxID=1387713 RepID=A0ABS3XN15_9ACTN|nr:MULTISPECIES: CGNR zinc finger domain-containing protein [Streptomyces]MBO8196799.1 CGNR zinc finger domain-containing protein [Streptomyces smyrnaeus]MBQ0862305.1 CGNR zinc finger domain-containing protein [Streptomyces sp. RK75]MBQ1159020.1 CGNR zinc finger domain-containing protein [Streptomyces sp. A73]